MGSIKSGKYRYSDDKEELTHCESCGCLTAGKFCSHCQEQANLKDYDNGLKLFLQRYYSDLKKRKAHAYANSPKNMERLKMKYDRFMKQIMADDQLIIHEVMAWRM